MLDVHDNNFKVIWVLRNPNPSNSKFEGYDNIIENYAAHGNLTLTLSKKTAY